MMCIIKFLKLWVAVKLHSVSLMMTMLVCHHKCVSNSFKSKKTHLMIQCDMNTPMSHLTNLPKLLCYGDVAAFEGVF